MLIIQENWVLLVNSSMIMQIILQHGGIQENVSFTKCLIKLFEHKILIFHVKWVSLFEIYIDNLNKFIQLRDQMHHRFYIAVKGKFYSQFS
jgi:hypothetical protein